jgi:hypothetical protein
VIFRRGFWREPAETARLSSFWGESAYRIFRAAATGSLRLILYRHVVSRLDMKSARSLDRNCRSIELVAVDPRFRLDKRRPITPVTVLRFLSVDDLSRLKREAVIGGTEFEENLVARQTSH